MPNTTSVRKQHQGSFRLDIRENFLMKRVVKPWHRLPRVVVESHPWECSKPCGCAAWGQVAALEVLSWTCRPLLVWSAVLSPIPPLVPGQLPNEAGSCWRVRDHPGFAWMGMGTPARSRSPGQLENSGLFLRAFLLLFLCRHGKDLHGQSCSLYKPGDKCFQEESP